MRLARGEEGYQVGAYMFNIVAAELVFAAIFLGVLASTWPTPPWDLLLYGGVVLMVAVPFLFYPFSKTIFLAFDLVFRPPMPNDFDVSEPEQEGGPRAPLPAGDGRRQSRNESGHVN